MTSRPPTPDRTSVPGHSPTGLPAAGPDHSPAAGRSPAGAPASASASVPASASAPAFASASVPASGPARRLRKQALPAVAATILAGLLLGGCGAGPAPEEAAAGDQTQAPSATEAAPASGPQSATESATESAAPLTVHQPWVKAAESRMTGAFGVLTNNGTEDLRVVAATSPSAMKVELHETVAGPDGTFTMAETTDGFTIPAGADFALEPGANHLMLMGLEEPLLAGDEVILNLELEDGTVVEFTATVKDFSGANESYHGQ